MSANAEIVCTSGVLYGEEAFSSIGSVRVVPDNELRRETLENAEVLILRSGVRVDERLLGGSRVRFVGTATAGTDHLDLDYLESRGITWANAPGCNAQSVVEYVLAAILYLAPAELADLSGLTLGVVGCGNIGGRLADLATELGIHVLRNDPPREALEGKGGYITLFDMLPQVDIVSLHVPLTDSGEYPTRGLADDDFFALLGRQATFINTARGPVTIESALFHALEEDTLSHVVLDVWNNEPDFDPALLARVDIGTPHIAGHSLEGKLNGTLAVYQAACAFLGKEPVWEPDPLELPFPSTSKEIILDGAGRSPVEIIAAATLHACDIRYDDRALRACASGDSAQRSRCFRHLRRDYRPRREFRAWRVHLKNSAPIVADLLHALGFRLT